MAAPGEPLVGLGERLRAIAKDGEVNLDYWPKLVPQLLRRLDQIIDQVYPPTPPMRRRKPNTILRLPNLPFVIPTSPADPNSSSNDAPPADGGARESPAKATPEPPNDRASTPSRPPPPPALQLPLSPPVSQISRHTMAMTAIQLSIHDAVNTRFSKAPPWTVQRLAELLLEPERGNRTLGSFLRSVDTVLSATSTTTAFPIPEVDSLSASSSDAPAGIGGGKTGISQAMEATAIGASVDPSSDEAMGGALLTPIPWLKNRSLRVSRPDSDEMEGVEIKSSPPAASPKQHTKTKLRSKRRPEEDDMITEPGSPPRDPNEINVDDHNPKRVSKEDASPSPMSRAAGAVTQGELLRMEQEAGLAPASQIRRSVSGSTSPNTVLAKPTDSVAEEENEEIPHARGPSNISVEDTGPQSSSSPTIRSPLKTGIVDSQTSPNPSSHQPSSTDVVKSPMHANNQINIGGFDIEAALGRHTRSSSDTTHDSGRAELAIQNLERRREQNRQIMLQQQQRAREMGQKMDERESQRERERERSHERKTGERRRSSGRELSRSSRDLREESLSRRNRSVSPIREGREGRGDERGRGRAEAKRPGGDEKRQEAQSGQPMGKDEDGETKDEPDGDDENDRMEGIEKTG